jgi:N-carbamoylputrescine amidase
MSKVKVGLVQMSCSNNKEANLQKAIEKIKEAAAKGAQIVCLQELFTSLYFCDVEDYEISNWRNQYGPNRYTEQSGKRAECGYRLLFEKNTGIYHVQPLY